MILSTLWLGTFSVMYSPLQNQYIVHSASQEQQLFIGESTQALSHQLDIPGRINTPISTSSEVSFQMGLHQFTLIKKWIETHLFALHHFHFSRANNVVIATPIWVIIFPFHYFW